MRLYFSTKNCLIFILKYCLKLIGYESFVLLLRKDILQRPGDEIGTGLVASAILRVYLPIKIHKLPTCVL